MKRSNSFDFKRHKELTDHLPLEKKCSQFDISEEANKAFNLDDERRALIGKQLNSPGPTSLTGIMSEEEKSSENDGTSSELQESTVEGDVKKKSKLLPSSQANTLLA